MLGDVGGGQHHPLPQLGPSGPAASDGGDVEAAVVADGGDLVGLAVDRAAPVALDPARSQPLQRAWTRSPTPATVPCEASGTPSSVDAAEPDELGAQLRGQAGGLLVGVDQQQRALPGEGVGQPGAGGGLLGLLAGAGVEQPAVLVVGRAARLVAVAQPQRRLALPRRG